MVSDTARVSVPPVSGCELPAALLGKVAFDAVGLGVGPPCFRVDSEDALLKRTDERALLARAAPGVIPEMKLVTKFWMMGRRETTTGVKSLKYVLQMTASVWMPFNQTCEEDFDSFKMAPWDAGGTQWDEVHITMCRAKVHNIDGLTTKNTECVFPTNMLLAMNCPRLRLTPGEDDASYRDTLDKIHETMCRAMVHDIDGSTTRNTGCVFTTNRLLATNYPQLKMTPGEYDASYGGTRIGGNLQKKG